MVRFSISALSFLALSQSVSSWSNTAWRTTSHRSGSFSVTNDRLSTSRISNLDSSTRKSTTLSLSPDDVFNQATSSFDTLKTQLSNEALKNVDAIRQDVSTLKESFTTFLQNLEPMLSNPEASITSFQSQLSDMVSHLLTNLQDKSLAESIQDIYNTDILPLHNQLPAPVEIAVTAGVTYSLLTLLFNFNSSTPPSSPYPMKRYDADAARAYFDTRLDLVIGRALEVGFLSARFGLDIGLDYLK